MKVLNRIIFFIIFISFLILIDFIIQRTLFRAIDNAVLQMILIALVNGFIVFMVVRKKRN